jgi:hypothetical protein
MDYPETKLPMTNTISEEEKHFGTLSCTDDLLAITGLFKLFFVVNFLPNNLP